MCKYRSKSTEIVKTIIMYQKFNLIIQKQQIRKTQLRPIATTVRLIYSQQKETVY